MVSWLYSPSSCREHSISETRVVEVVRLLPQQRLCTLVAVADLYSHLTNPFLAHQGTLRGVVRYTLVAHQLAAHLPQPPARVADVGGGAGRQSLLLARDGYEVTVLDPSPAMLREAERVWASESKEVRRRVRLVEGAGERATEILGRESFDAVLCHGVLMYLEDSCPMLKALAFVARPRGVISVLAKNASALAMRPALEGRYGDALAALETDRDLGRLGAVTRAKTVEGLRALLKETRVGVVRWYGIRVFTDHLGDRQTGDAARCRFARQRLH
jgi:S-adenosylmethionine-dependent methyltransferase